MSASPSETTTSERRVITALFCDLVGSTSLAEAMDPEDWTEIVNQTVADMGRCVERFDGTVAQFAGDSILALFGAPTAHEDDPYRAIRAGLDIIESVRERARAIRRARGINVKVRAGAHTGLVIVGDVAAGDLNLYTALGDTTNVAARVQDLAQPGTLVISEDTYRLVTGDVEVEDLGSAEMKGKSEPIRVYEVTAARDVNTRRRGIPGLSSPMIGRSAELNRLVELVDAAATGAGRAAAVVGEPGVGKSRLIAELRGHVAGMPESQWIVGRCASFDQKRPYHLIESLVFALAGVTPADDVEAVEKAVIAMAEHVFGPHSPSEKDLFQLLGLEQGNPGEDAAVLKSRYTEAITSLMLEYARHHQPLVLICEDIHWADPSSSDLLANVMKSLLGAPLLLVLVTRPDDEADGWRVIERAKQDYGAASQRIDLIPLDGGESKELVANLLEIESLPHHLRELVLEKADGNPFYLEEVVRMLVDRDMIEQHEGRWIATSEISKLQVPGTLQALLASRIDLLNPHVQATGRLAAVIGRRFGGSLFEAVAMSLDPRGDRFLTDVAELEEHALVKQVATRPELTYAFRHALTHDVMYTSILRRERRELHEAVGRVMERLYADRLREVAPALARHYVEAQQTDKALRFLMVAGRAALDRHALPEAHRFFSEALDLIDGDEEVAVDVRIEVVLNTASAGMTFTPGDQSVALAESVLDDVRAAGDPNLLARAYSLSLSARAYMEQNYQDEGYRQVMDAAYALAPQVTDPGLRASLEGSMGQVLRIGDRYEAGFELLSGSVPRLEEAGRLGEASINATFAADALGSMGRFDEADIWITRSLALADRSGNPNVVADANLVRGRIASLRGDLEEALEHSSFGMTTAEGAGNVACSLVGHFLVADQQLRMGQAEEAIPHLQRTSELGEYCRADVYVALGEAWLASANARLGNLDPGGYAMPLRTAQEAGSRSGEAMVRLHRAIALAGAERPDVDHSIEDFETSIALFGSVGARPEQARALHAYGMALESAGKTRESTERLREASEMFEEMGMTADPANA